MNTLRDAAQQALEALEADNSKLWPSEKRTTAITALRAALAEPKSDTSSDYERGFIDGMQKQMQSSVDKAVNRMAALAEPQQAKPYRPPENMVQTAAIAIELEQLKAERDALLVDAERYRWLRDNVYAGVNRHNECLWAIRGLYEKDGQSFDAAIDAARGKT